MATNTLEILIKASDQASGVLSGMAKSIGGELSGVGKTMLKTGAIMTASTAPFVAALGSTVGAASAFEESMTNVGAVLGKSKSEMAGLNAEVLAIGAASRAGPQAASEAFYDIVGGVADASTHMAILQAAIATAEAGSADLGGTTSALIAIMNSYGFSADQAAFASDVLTQTVGAGVGSMEEFAAAMPQVAGLASSLGISFDDLGAGMAFLTTKGFSAAQSATQLRAMMVAMLNPNAQMTKALEEAGFASGSLAVEQLGLVGAFEALNDSSPTFQSNMAGAVGSVEALNGVIALTDDSFQSFSEDFVSSAEGATDAARKVQLDSFAAQVDILKSGVEALKIQIGMALLPVITRLVRGAQPVVQALIQWASANQPLIATVGKVIAGVTAFGLALTVAGGALAVIVPILGIILSPIGLIAAAFVGLAAVINSLGVDALDDLKRNVMDLFDAFKTLNPETILRALGDFAIDLIYLLTSPFEGLNTFIREKIGAELNALRTAFQSGSMSEIAGAFLVLGQALLTEAQIQIAAVDWTGIGETIIDGLMGGVSTISGMVDENIAQPIIGAISEINWSAIPGQLETILQTVLSMAAPLFQIVADTIFNPIVRAIQVLPWGTVGNFLDQIMGAVLSGAVSVGQWVIDTIWTPLTTGLGDSTQVQNISAKAGEIAASIITGLVDGIGDIAAWVKTNVIDKLVSALTGGGGGGEGGGGVSMSAEQVGMQILTGIANAFTNIALWTWNNVLWPFVSGLTGESNVQMLKDNVLTIGTELLNGIIEGLGDLPGFVLNDIILPLGAAIVENAPQVLNSALEIGAQIVKGIIDALAGVGQMILDAIVDQLNQLDIGSAITGAIGDAAGIIGGALGIGGKAIGGPVAAHMPYVVGERGPELFVPSTAGRIVPNSNLRGMEAGGRISTGNPVMNLDGAQIVLPGVKDARQFFDQLEREAKRRNRSFAYKTASVQ